MLTIEEIRGEFYIANRSEFRWHKQKFRNRGQAERYKTSLEESMHRSPTGFRAVQLNFVENMGECRLAQAR